MVNVFSVDSILYSDFTGKKDSVRFYIKEIIRNEKTDSTGYTTYLAELYLTYDTTKGWNYVSYYFYRKNEYHINLVKGNYTVTCFVFPVTKNRKWNMNTFNTNNPEYASYTWVATPWNSYLDCVQVFVKEDRNILEESVDKAVYSLNTGLVYKILSNIKINDGKKEGYMLITNRINK